MRRVFSRGIPQASNAQRRFAGSTVMWFGQCQGQPIAKLKQSYIDFLNARVPQWPSMRKKIASNRRGAEELAARMGKTVDQITYEDKTLKYQFVEPYGLSIQFAIPVDEKDWNFGEFGCNDEQFTDIGRIYTDAAEKVLKKKGALWQFRLKGKAADNPLICQHVTELINKYPSGLQTAILLVDVWDDAPIKVLDALSRTSVTQIDLNAASGEMSMATPLVSQLPDTIKDLNIVGCVKSSPVSEMEILQDCVGPNTTLRAQRVRFHFDEAPKDKDRYTGENAQILEAILGGPFAMSSLNPSRKVTLMSAAKYKQLNIIERGGKKKDAAPEEDK